MTDRIVEIIKKLSFKLISRKRYNELNNAKKTYSQIGEDIIISYAFNLKKIHLPTYLDIGANDPAIFNNTYIFYQRGIRGINIDANPYSIKKFNHLRPLDKNINVGISSTNSKLPFYLMEDDKLSTFSEFELNKLLKLGKKLQETIYVPTLTIADLLANYNNNIMPDLLSIDTEGLDSEIIQQLDFNIYRPKIICIETSEFSLNGVGNKHSDLINYIIGKDYFEYASTYLNSIFIDKKWFF